MSDGYFCVTGRSEYEIVINRSRFITTLVPIENAEQAFDEIKKISKKYSDATHNCYAYAAGQFRKSSDDGEPAGTAGQPMAEVLKKRGADMMLAVVTRYFGGIKLGASGLISAYSGCVARALDEAPVKIYRLSAVVKAETEYALSRAAESLLLSLGAQIDERQWEGGAQIIAALPAESLPALEKGLNEKTLGKGKLRILREEYRAYPLQR